MERLSKPSKTNISWPSSEAITKVGIAAGATISLLVLLHYLPRITDLFNPSSKTKLIIPSPKDNTPQASNEQTPDQTSNSSHPSSISTSETTTANTPLPKELKLNSSKNNTTPTFSTQTLSPNCDSTITEKITSELSLLGPSDEQTTSKTKPSSLFSKTYPLIPEKNFQEIITILSKKISPNSSETKKIKEFITSNIENLSTEQLITLFRSNFERIENNQRSLILNKIKYLAPDIVKKDLINGKTYNTLVLKSLIEENIIDLSTAQNLFPINTSELLIKSSISSSSSPEQTIKHLYQNAKPYLNETHPTFKKNDQLLKDYLFSEIRQCNQEIRQNLLFKFPVFQDLFLSNPGLFYNVDRDSEDSLVRFCGECIDHLPAKLSANILYNLFQKGFSPNKAEDINFLIKVSKLFTIEPSNIHRSLGIISETKNAYISLPFLTFTLKFLGVDSKLSKPNYGLAPFMIDLWKTSSTKEYSDSLKEYLEKSSLSEDQISMTIMIAWVNFGILCFKELQNHNF